VSLFQVHPHTVVSLDYIKSQERRAHFLHHCPDFVIVDEAHTCVGNGQGRHQRYELLRGLADARPPHVLLTATPHSGDDAAFYRLLGLLDRSFERSRTPMGAERDRLRDRLGNHFVQRRRPDIESGKSPALPEARDQGAHLPLSGAWDTFFSAVLDYCAEIVERTAGDAEKQRLNFWGTLALLRCAASSPMAAVLALRTRAGEDDARSAASSSTALRRRRRRLIEDDVEPPAATEDPALAALVEQAERARGAGGRPQAQGPLRPRGTNCSTRTTASPRRLLPLHRHRALPGPPPRQAAAGRHRRGHHR
jgi:hypothetical protein